MPFRPCGTGQSGRISGVCIEVEGGYPQMLALARQRERQNRDGDREPYDLVFNSCPHFAAEVVEAGGVDMPIILDPSG